MNASHNADDCPPRMNGDWLLMDSSQGCDALPFSKARGCDIKLDNIKRALFQVRPKRMGRGNTLGACDIDRGRSLNLEITFDVLDSRWLLKPKNVKGLQGLRDLLRDRNRPGDICAGLPRINHDIHTLSHGFTKGRDHRNDRLRVCDPH